MILDKQNGKKKPHFVSEVRILRQYERCELVTCHLLYTLCNETAKIINYIIHKQLNKIEDMITHMLTTESRDEKHNIDVSLKIDTETSNQRCIEK